MGIAYRARRHSVELDGVHVASRSSKHEHFFGVVVGTLATSVKDKHALVGVSIVFPAGSGQTAYR